VPDGIRSDAGRSFSTVMKIGMSTSCVFPESTATAFAMAKQAGYDGVEVMVTQDPVTRDPARLLALSKEYDLPILSIHAPVLLLTQFVWGTDPGAKLEKSAELAAAVGASTVVVHPPFRWQHRYGRRFLDSVDELGRRTGLEIAVENMFTWSFRGHEVRAYSPGWDPTRMVCDSVTLDFSHAALSGRDSLEMARQLGSRLRHVHLCDGKSVPGDGKVFDEHLVPGTGRQPVAETLQLLAARGWSGSIVAEVNTRPAGSREGRLDMLRDTVAFARLHTTVPTPSPVTAKSRQPAR
jgi:sugar phosphate isomerase/epimerase